jgi:hypothetical protein
MKQEDIEKIVSALKEEQVKIQDYASQSASLTFSSLIQEIQKDIQEVREEARRDKKEIMEKLDPLYSAFQKAGGFKAGLYLIGATLAAIAGTLVSWDEIVKRFH